MSNRPIITLRGCVRRQEGGGWEWTGIWAFGALPDDDRDNTTEEAPTVQAVPLRKKKGKRKFNNVKGARPFRYHVSLKQTNWFPSVSCFETKILRTAPYVFYVVSKIWIRIAKKTLSLTTHVYLQPCFVLRLTIHQFCEARDASKVSVPWLNDSANDLSDNDTEKAETTASPLVTIGSNDAHASPKTYSPIAKAAVEASEVLISENSPVETAVEPIGKSCSEKKGSPVDTGQHNGSKDTFAPTTDPSPRASLEVVDRKAHLDNEAASAVATSTVSRPVTSNLSHGTVAAVEEEESSSVITNSSSSYARPLPKVTDSDYKSETNLCNGTAGRTEKASLEKNQTEDQQQPSTSSSTDLTTHVDESNLTNGSQQAPNKPLSSSLPEPHQQNDHSSNAPKNVDRSGKEVVTFASLTPYVDASIKYPDLCPCGGLWKGYFENVQVSYTYVQNIISFPW
jgi:hypothetical protein